MANAKQNIDELFDVGAHYAMSRRVRHPSMSDIIFGCKNSTEIFDLNKVSQYLDSTLEEIKRIGKEEGNILFVGSRKEGEAVIQSTAKKLGMPYSIGRWIGGTITNFDEIYKRIQRMEELEKKQANGELNVYTKKEQLLLQRELSNLKKNFDGIRNLKKSINYIFVLDTNKESIAVKEAQNKGLKIIGLVNSNANLNQIDFPIIGNITNQKSLNYFMSKVVEAYQEGKKQKDK